MRLRRPLGEPTRSVLLALFVTLLWSSSWVFIKLGLGSLPPLTFAGLRYVLAFLLLAPFLLLGAGRGEVRRLSRRDWGALLLLGVVYYTLTQGEQYLALDYLPANTLSLMLTLSGITIALAGRFFLGERLSALQWSGVFVSIGGALAYFGTVGGVSELGLLFGTLCVAFNTAGAILGRAVNRRATLSPLLVTVVSMGPGAILLLAAGLLTEPFPQLTASDALVILWLAAVNTAFAFTVWNLTLRTLSAAESGVINNTMLIQIAALAWIFLGEELSAWQIFGLGVALAGTLMVQVRPRRVVESRGIG
ncbi:MAG: DMT family transporter [Anaerolineales bacterium]